MDPRWIEASQNWLDEVRLLSGKYFRSDLQVTDKEDASPVTIADKKIEALIRERIRSEFPDYGIIGEEEAVKGEVIVKHLGTGKQNSVNLSSVSDYLAKVLQEE